METIISQREMLSVAFSTGGSYVVGSFVTAGLAVLLSALSALSIAFFVVEYYRNTFISNCIKHLLVIFRNIPSIIWGICAFYVLPGRGIFTIALVLSVMITPYASSWIATILNRVSVPIRESAYCLGATPGAVIGKIILPMAGKGIVAAYMLAFAKALSETMIVAVFAGNTIASGLLYSFPSHTAQPVWGVLALVLFLVTTGINCVASSVMRKYIE